MPTMRLRLVPDAQRNTYMVSALLRAVLEVANDDGTSAQVTAPQIVVTLADASTVTYSSGWQPTGTGGWVLSLPLDSAGTWGLAATCGSHPALNASASLSVLDPAGVDATGVAQPSGGRGIRGWLSGAYSRLSAIATAIAGTLKVAEAAYTPATPTAGSTAWTLPTGGTSQQLLAAGEVTRGGWVTNPGTAAGQGIAAAETAYLTLDGSAPSTTEGGSVFALAPGQTMVLPALTTAVRWVAATTGHKLSVWRQ